MILKNIKKTLGNFTLDITRLTIPGPGIYGLIGSNGCGKSTLAKIAAGIMPTDSGTIDPGRLCPQEITMITQKPYIMDDTVYNNLVYPLKLRNIKPDAALCETLLGNAGLRHKQNQKARSLSGGEQQKLALCRAMIFKPKMIIADESFTDLDIDSLDMFEKMILDMQGKDPVIWLLISHQFSHIRRLCNYLFFMADGKIEAEGLTEEMIKTKNPAVRAYLRHETIEGLL